MCKMSLVRSFHLRYELFVFSCRNKGPSHSTCSWLVRSPNKKWLAALVRANQFVRSFVHSIQLLGITEVVYSKQIESYVRLIWFTCLVLHKSCLYHYIYTPTPEQVHSTWFLCLFHLYECRENFCHSCMVELKVWVLIGSTWEIDWFF